ncbi:MAG: universal stress protein [Myxococcales bacterium]|nr:universal stress protein [Myxococcales bacterium]
MIPITRILVPIDFSSCSLKALDYALAFADKLKSTIDLLFVWEKPFYVGDEVRLYSQVGDQLPLEAYAHERALEDLTQLANSRRSRISEPIETHVATGRPHEQIVAYSTGRAQLIVMGTHGRSGLLHLLLGSVAEKVIRQAPCPVLTIGLTPAKQQVPPRSQNG